MIVDVLARPSSVRGLERRPNWAASCISRPLGQALCCAGNEVRVRVAAG